MPNLADYNLLHDTPVELNFFGDNERIFISDYLSRCTAFNDDYIVALHRNAFHWRMRDCIFNQANCWGAS